MTAGVLVEFGASASPLAAVLLKRLPSVLQVARECADACLADPRTPAEVPEDEELDLLTEVDQRPVLREVFRDHLEKKRAFATLAYLEQWTLAAVASWTRSRNHLIRASCDANLGELATRMDESAAHWLRTLLGVQIDSSWLVLCPVASRGFRVLLDGVVSNQDLHVQLAAALVPRGIDGTACSDEIVAYLEGRAERPRENHVEGTWNLYDYRAASLDLSDGNKVPTKYWVWAEGIPNDIPRLAEEPALIVGPASIERSWSLGRIFSALPSRVSVIEELPGNEFEAEWTRIVVATRQD